MGKAEGPEGQCEGEGWEESCTCSDKVRRSQTHERCRQETAGGVDEDEVGGEEEAGRIETSGCPAEVMP